VIGFESNIRQGELNKQSKNACAILEAGWDIVSGRMQGLREFGMAAAASSIVSCNIH